MNTSDEQKKMRTPDSQPRLNPRHAAEFSDAPDVGAHMKKLRDLYPTLNPEQGDPTPEIDSASG